MGRETEELYATLSKAMHERSAGETMRSEGESQNPPIIQLYLSSPEWLFEWNRERLHSWEEMLTTRKVNRMNVSQKGITLLKFLEGFRSTPYLCPGGVWTIGYGHTRSVRGGMKITKPMAEELLKEDLYSMERAIARLVTVELTQDQFDALALFVFNVGVHSLDKSSLLKRLNKGWYSQVPAQLAKWVYADGKKLNGLVRRRKAEIGLWNKPKPARSEGES